VKWSDYLNEFLNRGLNGDSQWLPVNRRFIHEGVYFPSTTTIEVGEVVAIVDTSGSMSPTELACAFGELAEFKRMYACQLHIIQADAAVCDYKEYDRSEELPDKFPTHGRGGTSFNPAFKYIAEKGIQPRLIVYFTDGEGSCTVDPPPYPVLWVQIPWSYSGSKSWSGFKAPFGEHIKVE
jgi:predicted metal-dependent peptidase